jgi:hypothetical protein
MESLRARTAALADVLLVTVLFELAQIAVGRLK